MDINDSIGKDTLISLNPAQTDPGKAMASDFSYASKMGKAGDQAGKDQLVTLSHNQESPRDAEDGSRSDRDSMAEKGAATAANFKVGQAGVRGKSLSMPESVDLSSGDIMVSGVKQTKMKEVADKDLSI